MKKNILFTVFILACLNTFAQSTYPIEADTIKMRKRGGGNAVLDVIGTIRSTQPIIPGTDTTGVKKGIVSINGDTYEGNGFYFRKIRSTFLPFDSITDKPSIFKTNYDSSGTLKDSLATTLRKRDSVLFVTPKKLFDSLYYRIKQGGNSFGTTFIIGSNDNQDVYIKSNNAIGLILQKDGTFTNYNGTFYFTKDGYASLPNTNFTGYLIPPNDTTYIKSGIALIGNQIYVGNNNYWVAYQKYLGFTPYNATNPAGFISSYTETDPIWSGVASNYRTKTQNDALYAAINHNHTQSNIIGLSDSLVSKENTSNKATSLATNDNTHYPTTAAVKSVTDANTTNITTNTAAIATSNTNISNEIIRAIAAEVLRVKYTDTTGMFVLYQAAINKHTDTLTAHKISIGTNTTNIATNTTAIATNATNIFNEITRALSAEAAKLDTSGAFINTITENADVLYGVPTYTRSFHTGTITQNLNSQAANKVFASPNGSSGTPTFRNLILADLPALANLTATNSTLTFSGTYNGLTAQTIGLNLANANTWTGVPTFSANVTNNFSNGLDIQPTLTGNGNYGMYIHPTLVATGNNQTTTGVLIAPTFTNGAYTGVVNYSLNVSGNTNLGTVTVGNISSSQVINANNGLFVDGQSNSSSIEFRMRPTNTSNAYGIRGYLYPLLTSTAYGTITIFDNSNLGSLGTGNTLGTFIGFHQRKNVNATNNIAVLLSDAGTIPTGNWAIYNSNTYSNFFTSKLLIGTTTDAGYTGADINGTVRIQSTLTTSVDAVINTVNIGLGGTSNSYNLALGTFALNTSTATYGNIAFGKNTLSNPSFSGSYNVVSGYGVLAKATTASSNVIIGSYYGGDNISAGGNLTTGNANAIIGTGAFRKAVNSSYNSVLGYIALTNLNNTIVASNFLVGVSYTIVSIGTTDFTLIGASSNTVGLVFTATGVGSGTGTAYNNVASNNNVVVGYASASTASITIMQNSIILGALSNPQADNQTNQTVIGYNLSGLGSNTTVINNSIVTFTAIQGALAVNTTTNAGYTGIDVNGTSRIQNTLTVVKYQLSALNTAPTSSTDTGTTGEIRWVNGYIYLCVATNTWQRTALSTF